MHTVLHQSKRKKKDQRDFTAADVCKTEQNIQNLRKVIAYNMNAFRSLQGSKWV